MQLIGYAGYFRLINGFEKTVYWSKEDITAHAQKFSKTFKFKNGVWQTDFDAMAKKTVLRNMLSKWGILSIDMQQAYVSDNQAIKKEILDASTEDINITANIDNAIEVDHEVSEQ